MKEILATLQRILDFQLLSFKGGLITVRSLVIILLFLAIAKAIFFLLKRFFLVPYYKRKGLDRGRRISVTTLVQYLYVVLMIIVGFHIAGVNLTVVLAASAALLVGVGIGLQQTFNDLLSGVILLVEGSVKPGDWVEIQSTEGKVLNIGLRTSLIETRSRVAIIVPNSKLTADNVINLSHNADCVRYSIMVGVSYRSDIAKVDKILHEAVNGIYGILKTPVSQVRLKDFGDSSLDFELLFWSNEYHRIEDVKSELRTKIFNMFHENGVEIPFPQRDLHLVSENIGFKKAIHQDKGKKA